jgi:hypothetical protein
VSERAGEASGTMLPRLDVSFYHVRVTLAFWLLVLPMHGRNSVEEMFLSCL